MRGDEIMLGESLRFRSLLVCWLPCAVTTRTARAPAAAVAAAVRRPRGRCATPPAIGFFGALTGDAANLGINIKRGVELAVEQWNAANAGCKVTLKDYDSQGDPQKALALADQAIADKTILGIVGPAFSVSRRR